MTKEDMITTFQFSRLNRLGRNKPEILIVEDMEPSRKLLKALIGNAYKCHAAADAAEATDLYIQHAPDVVFLDIELPDGNGHDLACLFNEFDPDSYIIMATAQNYEQDVNIAIENKVKGYIIKPLNLDKILKCMDNYFSFKKNIVIHDP